MTVTQAPADTTSIPGAAESLVWETDTRFRLHSAVYTSPRIFELELSRIFGRCWLFLGYEGSIPEPGDYLTTTMGLQPVIVTRTDGGEIAAMLNRCAHRASVVCREERGRATTFRCPYHGWVYRNDGTLIGAAQRQGYPDDFMSWGLRLPPVRVESYRGLIFGTLDPDAVPLLDRLDGVRRYIDLWCDRSPTGRYDIASAAHRYSYEANWKFQMENGVDGYHGNYIHESFTKILERSGERKATDITRARNNVSAHNYAIGLPCGDALLERESGMLGTYDFSRHPEFAEALRRQHDGDRVRDIMMQRNIFIFPNLFLFESHIRVVRPVRLDHTYVDVHPVHLQGVDDQLNIDRLKEHERFFGPASFGAPDDIEAFLCVQTGAQATVDPWLEMSRGMHREERLESGEVRGHSTDETTQRAQYREWRQLMRGGEAR
ncbi:aromatic ring-hydroxylating oxygenase subunit alpha [Actinophytocola sp.]|uniref:aromatic ring-hydroxylating oxygenase subunit alpha n=1 Tax=Actinophytocola sp. TaxID=1872138 RepID=UPI003D6B197D